MDWDKEEEKGMEDYPTSDEDSDDEEPRIKDVLNNLSKAVSRKDASELLHSMATSKNILFWTLSGPKPARYTNNKHLRAGRVCVTPS